ncbi:MAG TPA: hypothetical protein VHB77_11010 [Planctomycetaceae bacterium]|nr:hypothetical protein [Planctomycetaceae bacterium]
MLELKKWRSAIGSTSLLAAVLLAGCGRVSQDEAMYKDNQEATLEHMKEINDEEQAHFAEVERTNPTPAVSANAEYSAGAAEEEARFRQ